MKTEKPRQGEVLIKVTGGSRLSCGWAEAGVSSTGESEDIDCFVWLPSEEVNRTQKMSLT